MILEQIAEQIIGLCRERRMRLSRLNLERRLPAESRVAVQWLERFETYYRIWTAVSGVQNDLEAAITSRDGEGGVEDPIEESRRYARYALFHFACFLAEMRWFAQRYGGLWLFSDPDVEQTVANAVYRISWHVEPFNEQDNAHLVRIIVEGDHGDIHDFHAELHSEPAAAQMLRDWQAWVATCLCPRNDAPRRECSVHQVIAQCRLFQQLVDDDWEQIADWYRIEPDAVVPVEASRLYLEHVENVDEMGNSFETD